MSRPSLLGLHVCRGLILIPSVVVVVVVVSVLKDMFRVLNLRAIFSGAVAFFNLGIVLFLPFWVASATRASSCRGFLSLILLGHRRNAI